MLVSIDNVMFPVPPGGMTLSHRVATQPQVWASLFIFSVADPRFDTTKVWVNSAPSKTVEKTWLVSAIWIIGPSPDCAGHNGFLKNRLMDRKKRRKNVFKMCFVMILTSNAYFWGFYA